MPSKDFDPMTQKIEMQRVQQRQHGAKLDAAFKRVDEVIGRLEHTHVKEIDVDHAKERIAYYANYLMNGDERIQFTHNGLQIEVEKTAL